MDIQIKQILFQIVNISVVIGALSYFLYNPILDLFEERTKKIAEGQKAAEDAIKNKEELEKAKKRMETDLKKEKAEILEEARKEAQVKAEKIVADAKKEAKATLEGLNEAWEKEKASLVKEAKKDMTDAIIAVSKKLVDKSLDSKAHMSLIDEELSEILKKI